MHQGKLIECSSSAVDRQQSRRARQSQLLNQADCFVIPLGNHVPQQLGSCVLRYPSENPRLASEVSAGDTLRHVLTPEYCDEADLRGREKCDKFVVNLWSGNSSLAQLFVRTALLLIAGNPLRRNLRGVVRSVRPAETRIKHPIKWPVFLRRVAGHRC